MSHQDPNEKGGLQGAALRGLRSQSQARKETSAVPQPNHEDSFQNANELLKTLVTKGRQWLRDSPEKPIRLAEGFLGAHTPLAFVCAHCVGRLRGRGCDVDLLVKVNVFAPQVAPAACALCACGVGFENLMPPA